MIIFLLSFNIFYLSTTLLIYFSFITFVHSSPWFCFMSQIYLIPSNAIIKSSILILWTTVWFITFAPTRCKHYCKIIVMNLIIPLETIFVYSDNKPKSDIDVTHINTATSFLSDVTQSWDCWMQVIHGLYAKMWNLWKVQNKMTIKTQKKLKKINLQKSYQMKESWETEPVCQ